MDGIEDPDFYDQDVISKRQHEQARLAQDLEFKRLEKLELEKEIERKKQMLLLGLQNSAPDVHELQGKEYQGLPSPVDSLNLGKESPNKEDTNKNGSRKSFFQILKNSTWYSGRKDHHPNVLSPTGSTLQSLSAISEEGSVDFSEEITMNHFNVQQSVPSKRGHHFTPHSGIQNLQNRHKDLAIHELCQLQRQFVKQLTCLESFYFETLPSLIANGSIPITKHELISLQKDIPELVQLCRNLNLDLDDSTNENIGALFLNFQNEFSYFREYIKNMDSHQSLLQSLISKHPKFRQVTQEFSENEPVRRQTLNEIALTPFQMCSRYPNLLLAIQKYEIQESEAYYDLQKAANMITDLLSSINATKSKQDKSLFLIDLLQKIKDLPTDLFSARKNFFGHVHFVFTLSEKTFLRTLVLFEDYMIIVKPHFANQSNKIHDIFTLNSSQSVLHQELQMLPSPTFYTYKTHFFYQDIATWSILSDSIKGYSLAISMDTENFYRTNATSISQQQDKNGSKLSLTMSRAKVSLFKNFSQLSLATKKKSMAFTQKICSGLQKASALTLQENSETKSRLPNKDNLSILSPNLINDHDSSNLKSNIQHVNSSHFSVFSTNSSISRRSQEDQLIGDSSVVNLKLNFSSSEDLHRIAQLLSQHPAKLFG